VNNRPSPAFGEAPHLHERREISAPRWGALSITTSLVAIGLCLLSGIFFLVFSPAQSGLGLLVECGLLLALFTGMLVWSRAAEGSSAALLFWAFMIMLTIDSSFRNRALTETSLDPQNLFKLLLWIGALAIALMRWRDFSPLLRKPAFLGLVLFGLWATISSVYSVVPFYSLGGGLSFLGLVLFAAVLAKNVGRASIYSMLLWAAALLLLGSIALYLLAPWRAMAVLEGGTVYRLAGIFTAPNTLGRLAALAYIVLFVGLLDKHLRVWSLPVLVVLLLAPVCLYLSQSRNSIIALLAAIFLVLAPRYKKLACAFIAVGLVLVFAAILMDVRVHSILSIFSRTGHIEEVTSFTGRTDIWDFIRHKIEQSPLLGFGYGSTKLVMPNEFRNFWGWTTTSAHNMYLQAWVTTGLIGVTFITLAIVGQVRDLFQSPSAFSVAILVFVIVSGVLEPGPAGPSPNVLTFYWALSVVPWLARTTK